MAHGSSVTYTVAPRVASDPTARRRAERDASRRAPSDPRALAQVVRPRELDPVRPADDAPDGHLALARGRVASSSATRHPLSSSPAIVPSTRSKVPVARPGRFELPTTGSVDQCSIQLSYGRNRSGANILSANLESTPSAPRDPGRRAPSQTLRHDPMTVTELSEARRKRERDLPENRTRSPAIRAQSVDGTEPVERGRGAGAGRRATETCRAGLPGLRWA